MNRLLAWLQELSRSVGRSAFRLSRGGRRLGIAAAIIVPLLALLALSQFFFQRQLVVDALQRSQEECSRANDNLLLAMSTLGDQIDHLDLESRLLPKEELAFYKAIYDQETSEPAERFARAMARRRAGVIHLKLGETDQTRLCFRLAINMLESLAAEKPELREAPKYRKQLAKTYAVEAEYHAANGDIAAAESRYEDGLALLSKLVKKFPDSEDLVADQARTWHSRGTMFARLLRYPEAEADLNRAVTAWLSRNFSQGESDPWLGSQRCELIQTWLHLSQLYRDTNRPSQAIALLGEAMATLAGQDHFQADLHYREECAGTLEKLAGAYSDNRQFVQSAAAYQKALAAYDALEIEYPEVSAFRERHALIESRLGSLTKSGDQRKEVR